MVWIMTAYDNCEIPSIVTDSTHTGIHVEWGTITRNFTATDGGGRLHHVHNGSK